MTKERMIELLEIEHECMRRGAHNECDRDCARCELVQDDKELDEMYTGAIALLKEQEAVKPVRDKETGRLWLCGNCGSYVGFEDNDPYDQNEFDKFCRECGRPVLWEGR